MIPTVQLLYKIDMKLNKLASTEHQGIPLENKIIVLNEAQIKLIKQKIDNNNNYGIGFDGFRKRYQDLQSLVVEHTKYPTSKTNSLIESYSSNLPDDFFLPVDLYITANKDKCKNRIIYIENVVKHSDVSTLLANKFYRPSFDFQLTFATITNNKIIVYSDGEFVAGDIYISYIRYPKYIDYEGYDKFDGTLSTTVDCELPAHLEDELVDLAVRELAMYTENVSAVQSAQARIQSDE